MEVKSGRERKRAYKLKGGQTAKQRARTTPQGLSEVWWRWAKRIAMEVEVEVPLSGRPWAEVWTRKEAKAWAQVKAQAEAKAWAEVWEGAWVAAGTQAGAEGRARAGVQAGARANTKARAETVDIMVAGPLAEAKQEQAKALALAWAWAWAWARGEARARGEKVPSALADSSTTRDILSSLNQHGPTHDLWHHPRKTRDEYWCTIHFIAPITRLPFELLREILFIIIDEASGPPSVLMLVCKHWHAIVTTIWASLNLGTRTPIDAVTRKLESNQLFLDVLVDTNSDRGDFIPSDGAFEAIFAAIEASSRWRSLVVESFQADLPEDLVNRRLQRCSNATMSRFTTFRVKSACQTSPLLDGLLRILGTTAGSGPTTMEINSANVVSFLAPAYPSIFHFVKVLSLNTPGIPNPVDLLPHLHQLETFTASYISFPIYHNDVNLPFVHTLRHLSLKAVSIQWMSGRTFHVLEHCTLIFPRHRHVLHAFSATLPNCKHLTFQGYPLEILGGISAHKLTHLSVMCSGAFNRRGNQQLVWLSSRVLGESRLSPQVLHISIEAANRAWVDALSFMSTLVELVIYSAQPSSLGAQVFRSLVVQPIHANNLGATLTPGEFRVPLCPSLRRFGLKYDRWLRSSERFDLILVFASIIQSRERSNYSLQRFSIWMTSNQKGPLELVEGSRVSSKGLEHLANESGFTGEQLRSLLHGDWGRQEEDGSLSHRPWASGGRAGRSEGVSLIL